MQQKVFVMYRLRTDVSLDDYVAWSKEVDQRITPGQPGIQRFEVYAIEGHDGEGDPQIQIVEDIEVESWEAFQQAAAGDGMAYIRETFPRLADEASVITIYGSRIIASLPHGSRPPLPQKS